MLFNYVRTADARAMAGVQTRDVLVVTKAIAAGTPVEALGSVVELRSLPQSAVVGEALTSTEELTGLTTAVDLAPGEQLLRSRFVSPDQTEADSEIAIGKDQQELTLKLDPERVVGASLNAGEKVAVFISTDSPARTRLVARDVVVTRVQGATAGEEATAAAPADALLVTLALTPKKAERVVFGADHGVLYLAREADEPVTGTDHPIDLKSVYR